MEPQPNHKRITVDPESNTYRTTYCYPEEPPSLAIPLALMSMSDADVVDFEPLYTSVDPDSLDALFNPNTNTSGNRSAEFTFEGYRIRVEHPGRIQIQGPEP